MTDRIPWWKAFFPKRKSGAPKEPGPDFDPFAARSERPKEPTAAAPKTTGDPSLSQQGSNKGSKLQSEDTYDDSHLESFFNEQTCRRNMNVSRSGRFKEKRKVRSSLPIQERETENMGSGKEAMRWRGGDQRRLKHEDASFEAHPEVCCVLVEMVMKVMRSI